MTSKFSLHSAVTNCLGLQERHLLAAPPVTNCPSHGIPKSPLELPSRSFACVLGYPVFHMGPSPCDWVVTDFLGPLSPVTPTPRTRSPTTSLCAVLSPHPPGGAQAPFSSHPLPSISLISNHSLTSLASFMSLPAPSSTLHKVFTILSSKITA